MITATPFETRLFEMKNKFERTLPDRVAQIAQTLRRRQVCGEDNDSLGREFHNLAGTAGTFGFHSIAAGATDGFDACVEIGSGPIDNDARYLWSVLDDLAYSASRELFNVPLSHLIGGSLAPMDAH